MEKEMDMEGLERITRNQRRILMGEPAEEQKKYEEEEEENNEEEERERSVTPQPPTSSDLNEMLEYFDSLMERRERKKQEEKKKMKPEKSLMPKIKWTNTKFVTFENDVHKERKGSKEAMAHEDFCINEDPRWAEDRLIAEAREAGFEEEEGTSTSMEDQREEDLHIEHPEKPDDVEESHSDEDYDGYDEHSEEMSELCYKANESDDNYGYYENEYTEEIIREEIASIEYPIDNGAPTEQVVLEYLAAISQSDAQGPTALSQRPEIEVVDAEPTPEEIVPIEPPIQHGQNMSITAAILQEYLDQLEFQKPVVNEFEIQLNGESSAEPSTSNSYLAPNALIDIPDPKNQVSTGKKRTDGQVADLESSELGTSPYGTSGSERQIPSFSYQSSSFIPHRSVELNDSTVRPEFCQQAPGPSSASCSNEFNTITSKKLKIPTVVEPESSYPAPSGTENNICIKPQGSLNEPGTSSALPVARNGSSSLDSNDTESVGFCPSARVGLVPVIKSSLSSYSSASNSQRVSSDGVFTGEVSPIGQSLKNEPLSDVKDVGFNSIDHLVYPRAAPVSDTLRVSSPIVNLCPQRLTHLLFNTMPPLSSAADSSVLPPQLNTAPVPVESSSSFKTVCPRVKQPSQTEATMAASRPNQNQERQDTGHLNNMAYIPPHLSTSQENAESSTSQKTVGQKRKTPYKTMSEKMEANHEAYREMIASGKVHGINVIQDAEEPPMKKTRKPRQPRKQQRKKVEKNDARLEMNEIKPIFPLPSNQNQFMAPPPTVLPNFPQFDAPISNTLPNIFINPLPNCNIYYNLNINQFIHPDVFKRTIDFLHYERFKSVNNLEGLNYDDYQKIQSLFNI